MGFFNNAVEILQELIKVLCGEHIPSAGITQLFVASVFQKATFVYQEMKPP